MTESSKIEKAPERIETEGGLTPRERSVLVKSMNRHRRALEQLSRL